VLLLAHDLRDPLISIVGECLGRILEIALALRNTPPRPSTRAKAPKHAVVEWIAINPALAARLALRWAHEDAGLSQARLAKRMGVSQQAYARLESPDANLTMETLERAARALGLRVEVGLVRQTAGKTALVR
jgi:DNA-binding XRE family transcriptional regulator